MPENPIVGMLGPRPAEIPDVHPPEGTPNDPVNVPTPGNDIVEPGRGEPLGIPTSPGIDIPAPPMVPEVF